MVMCELGRKRLKIEIVEASEHVRIMLSAMVKLIRRELFLAANIDEGFTLAKTVKPDLIIADYGHDGSGAAFCRKLRQDPLLENTPFVMLSAVGGHLSRAEYMETGCDQLLYKPFQCMDLFVAIKAALSRDEDRCEKIVPVMYRSGECDLLDAKVLEQLIRAGEIDCFRRRDGLVIIGKDLTRQEEKADYEGSERRSLAI